MNKVFAFDALAQAYDQSFTNSVTGQYQRSLSRKWLKKFLHDKGSLDILEINCGTGEDALWLASQGHKVVATDGSPAMIERAQQKLLANNGNEPLFTVCTFEELAETFHDKKFDLVLSNFAGLNCISSASLQELLKNIHSLVRQGGHVAAVIFGKYCIWESLFYLSKFKPAIAGRRWNAKPSTVQFGPSSTQQVHYYSARAFTASGLFQLVHKKPVGLLVPPTYLETWAQKQKALVKRLYKIENKIGFSWMSHFADHTYILLKKPG